MNPTISDQTNPQNNIKLPVLKLLQYTVLIAAILYFGKTLFVPLSFAILISCILYPICSWMEKKGIPRSLSIGLALGILVLLIAGIVYLLFKQIVSFSHEWSELKLKLVEALNNLTSFLIRNLNVSLDQQKKWLEKITDNMGSHLFSFAQNAFYSLSVGSVFLILIPVISALILYHRQQFLKVIYGLFPAGKKDAVHGILHDVIHTYYSFIKGMLLVYLIVGTLNSIGLYLIGIPHPVLFGFMASVLTFIPYVGIIVASLLPISVAWLEYDSIWYPLGVIMIFTFVQYLEANIIFPMAVSSRLKINSLVTIVAIIAGGILWGASGMILFIPFLGILKLIADKAEGMGVVAAMLGTGK